MKDTKVVKVIKKKHSGYDFVIITNVPNITGFPKEDLLHWMKDQLDTQAVYLRHIFKNQLVYKPV